MIKKLLCIGLALALVLCAGLVWYSNQIIKHKDQVTCEMLSYKEKEIRLENMQKTLLTLYNISPYEAKYYSYIFDDFSQKYNLPWEAYPALIRIESNFNSGVMSKDRAKGMTQVLESTGKTQAQKLGIPFNEGTLWNCVLNMVIGFDFFSEGYAEKINETSKDSALKHAMKRYCGGPGYAKINPDARIYVKEYKMTLWEEYLRVSYVYKGVMYDQLMASKEGQKSQEVPIRASILYPFDALFSLLKQEKLSKIAYLSPETLLDKPQK